MTARAPAQNATAERPQAEAAPAPDLSPAPDALFDQLPAPPERPPDAARTADGGTAPAPPRSGAVIGIGAWAACAADVAGLVRCWGLPQATGNGGNRNEAPAGVRAVALSAHHHAACAILAEPPAPDDAIRCWGAAVTCWKGGGEAAAAPAEVLTVPAGLHARALCSLTYNCAVADDDRVVCWGPGAPQPPPALRARAVACGGWFEYGRGVRHACAIALDGTVACWGDATGGATAVPPGLHATSIAAGYQTSCAVDAGGAVVCWGKPGADHSGVSAGTRALPPGLMASEVFQNHETAAAVGRDGRLVVWGILRAPTPDLAVAAP